MEFFKASTNFKMKDRAQTPLKNIPDLTMNPRKLISFGWALKRLLRSKANYEVLEGFLSELP